MEIVSVFKSKDGEYHESKEACRIADLEYELKSYRSVLYSYMTALSSAALDKTDRDTFHTLLDSNVKALIVDTLFTCKDTILGIYEKQAEYDGKIVELQEQLVKEKRPQNWWTGIYRKLKS